MVYLDDIVIYSEFLEDHLEHLKKVLSKLMGHQLYAKNEKCEFVQQEIMFLGHKVSKGLMKMDERKVQAILDWPPPNKVAELRSFLGLANYYGKFVQGYSKKVASLTNLLKKDKKRAWTDACQEAFEKLKAAVSNESVLCLPDLSCHLKSILILLTK